MAGGTKPAPHTAKAEKYQGRCQKEWRHQSDKNTQAQNEPAKHRRREQKVRNCSADYSHNIYWRN